MNSDANILNFRNLLKEKMLIAIKIPFFFSTGRKSHPMGNNGHQWLEKNAAACYCRW
jgi:hypothetical protein